MRAGKPLPHELQVYFKVVLSVFEFIDFRSHRFCSACCKHSVSEERAPVERAHLDEVQLVASVSQDSVLLLKFLSKALRSSLNRFVYPVTLRFPLESFPYISCFGYSRLTYART